MNRDNPAKESLKQEKAEQADARRKGEDSELTKALEDTFPASDPIAAQTPVKPGDPKKS